MKAFWRENGFAVAVAALGLSVLGWLSLESFAFNDYDTESSAAFSALTSGHPLAFLQLAPAYGGSLVMRAPFALVPGLWHGGPLAVYRLVSLPALLAAGALGVHLVARMRAAGHSRLARASVLGLCVCSPIAMKALQIGHPEEMLGAVLCVAAMLAARSGRAGWAGLLLGLAVADKAWALVAVLPVLLAAPAGRWRLAAVAGAVAVAILAPLAVAQRTSYLTGDGAAARTGPIFRPNQLWWFLGSDRAVVRGSDGRVKPGYRAAPSWVPRLAHPLIVLLAVPLSVLWLIRRSRRPWEPLALLCLLLLLRCLLDPWNYDYYALPMLLALLAWEALGQREPPFMTLGATICVWVCFQELPGRVSPDVQALAYLGWTLPLAAGIAMWLYAPATWARVRAAVAARLGHRAPAAPAFSR